MGLSPRIAAGFLAFTALVATACRAEAEAPARRAPAGAPAAKLDADLEGSRIYIKVTSGSRLGHDHGVVGRLESGWVQPGRGGELVFAMKTFVTDTPDARRYVGLSAPIKPADQQKSTANMLGAHVLHVQKYPRATFKIDSVDPAEGQAAGSPGLYQLHGTFTLHGASRALTLNARLEPLDSGTTRLHGAFAIQQSQFGIVPYSALGGMVSIKDQLEIWGDIALRPEVAQVGSSPARRAR